MGHPRPLAKLSVSSSLEGFHSFPTRATTSSGRFRGGTQKDDPGMKGSQSGVDFCTKNAWMASSNFRILIASTSLSDEGDVDGKDWMSISISLPDREDLCLRFGDVSAQGATAECRRKVWERTLMAMGGSSRVLRELWPTVIMDFLSGEQSRRGEGGRLVGIWDEDGRLDGIYGDNVREFNFVFISNHTTNFTIRHNMLHQGLLKREDSWRHLG